MKGYPKSRFEITDETSFVDIPTTNSENGTIPVFMGTYSSDKGTEDWSIITSLDDFIDQHGPISFARHGQAQLQIAEALRNGAYVFGKRIMSDDAKLANVTVKATVVNSNNVSYLYFGAVTNQDAIDFDDAVRAGYGDFDSSKDPEAYETPSIKDPSDSEDGSDGGSKEDPSSPGTVKPGGSTTTPPTTPDSSTTTSPTVPGGSTGGASGDSGIEGHDLGSEGAPSVDTGTDGKEEVEVAKSTIITIPLFTIAATGRGVSAISFNIIPEYSISKGSQYIKYSLQVIENNSVIESILFSMNPNKITDGVNQSIETKVANMSNQIVCKVYEDGINKLVVELAKTATLGSTTVIDSSTSEKKTVPTPLSATQLINYDYINAKNVRGNQDIGGIVTIDSANPDNKDDLWTKYTPSSIKDTIVDLQSVEGIALVSGTYGKLGYSPVTKGVYSDEYNKLTSLAYDVDPTGNIAHPADPVIYDLDNYAIDAIFDANYNYEIKRAIINIVDYRGDCVFISDLGINAKDKNGGDIDVLTKMGILDAVSRLPFSKFVAVYGQYVKVPDPFTKKEITVTFPYLLVSKLASHIMSGVGKPFAGINNGLTFPDVVNNSVSFIPNVIPDEDQRQDFVDANVNYACYYNGLLTMDTMYTNQEDYTKLSLLHNVMLVQEVIKVIRTKCPSSRYTFMEGEDLEDYITDATSIINEYKTYFDSIQMIYMADEKYESNNIFYAVIKVKFKNFVQEEYFKVIAIN